MIDSRILLIRLLQNLGLLLLLLFGNDPLASLTYCIAFSVRFNFLLLLSRYCGRSCYGDLRWSWLLLHTCVGIRGLLMMNLSSCLYLRSLLPRVVGLSCVDILCNVNLLLLLDLLSR
jgi:hypothetical protein